MTHVRAELAAAIPGMMKNLDQIRNIGIVAHIHHGKTTLSDNLLAAAGMISNDLAGKQLYLNFDEQEQARLLTINNADVTIVHEYENQQYLINLIDTPGHVDFGGDVTRAMRAVDGAVVVVCAVEGVMAQTETVLRQALREKVKPVLFINKVDRAIKELKLTADSMQKRFTTIITEVNELIRRMAPEEFVDEWSVDPRDGSVAFGSGYENWAISIPYMLKTGVKFPDIFDFVSTGRSREIAQRARINDVVFDMVVKHLPTPKVAQRYRIPNIWRGDPKSTVGLAMSDTSAEGPTTFMVTDITMDPNAGEIATGRVFSGRLVKGMELNVVGTKIKNRVQHVSLFMGPERLMVEEVQAGNIAAVIGLTDAFAGTTMSNSPEMVPFEEIRHVSEPVVTVAIEPKHMGDLPKLIETMRKVGKEDASLKVEINQETGEHLLSGMGELHLEITQYPDHQRLQGRDHLVEADRRLPGDGQGARRTIRGEVPEQAQQVLLRGRGAAAGGRRRDPRGRDPPGEVVQGHEDARHQDGGARHLARRGPRDRRRRWHEHPVRRHEGDPEPQRNDGPRRRRLQGGDEPRAAREREGLRP